MTVKEAKKTHEHKQIEIFYGSRYNIVTQVNEFLMQRQAKDIHDIKLIDKSTQASPDSYSCLVVYTEMVTE